MIRALLIPGLGALLLIGVLIWGAAIGGFPAWLLGMGAASVGLLLFGLFQQEAGNWRQTLLSLAYCLFVFLSVIFAYLLVANNARPVDITAQKINTLTRQSSDALSRLETPVHIAGFANLADHATLRQFLGLYEDATDRVSYDVFDPAIHVAEAARYGDTVYPGDLFITSFDSQGRQGRRIRLNLDPTEPARESKLSNAILRAAQDKDEKIYFTQGKGERPLTPPENQRRDTSALAWQEMARVLGEYVLPVEELRLPGDGRIPEDAALVVIADPSVDLFEGEREMLIDYLDEGGTLLVALEPEFQNPETETNLLAVLRHAGLGAPNSLLLDPYNPTAKGIPVIVVPQTQSPVLAEMEGAQPFVMQSARLIALAEDARPDAEIVALAATRDRTWLEDAAAFFRRRGTVNPSTVDEAQGVLTGAGSSYPTPSQPRGDFARVAIFGDADFLSDGVITPSAAMVALTTANWLTAQENPLVVPPRIVPPSRFDLTQRGFWLIVGTLTLMGLGILAGGVSYSAARRRMR